MRTNRLYQKHLQRANLWVMALVLLTILSCNKAFENKLDLSPKGEEQTGARVPKVLYIIIDGARGAAINTLQAPALSEITENAMQTFSSVSDVSGLPSTTWADMLTGVNKAKHKVTQADFSGNNLANYPMFFKRVKQNDANIRTAAFSSTTLFSQKLVTDADVNQNFSNDDAAVKTALVAELKNEKAAVVLAEFNSVETAGQQYGYDAGIPQYRTAVLTVDGYIAEAMAALKQRPGYEDENWLVVVASNKGGSLNVPPGTNDGTLFSNPLLNGFVIFYNPRFSFQYYARPNTIGLPYEGKGIVLHGDTTANIPAAKATAYNFGKTGEFTLEFKLKVIRRAYSAGNSPILFKSSNPANSATGWWFMHSGITGNWRLGGLAASTMVSNQPILNIGEWYTLGFKIYNESGKRWVMIYQDGVKAFANPVDITNRDASNSEELVAGFRSGFGGSAENIISEIKIFNVAIPDNVIAANACKGALSTKHPYYNNLIGYWPCTDGISGFFQDKGPLGNDFVLKNKFEWVAFRDYAPKLCIDLPEDIYTRLPNGIDIPSMIYGWMGIKTNNMSLDGKTWIPVYNSIKP